MCLVDPIVKAMKMRSIQKILLLFIVATLLLLCWNLAQRHGDGQLHVTFLDVGQGDACVIEVTVSGRIAVLTGG